MSNELSHILYTYYVNYIVTNLCYIILVITQITFLSNPIDDLMDNLKKTFKFIVIFFFFATLLLKNIKTKLEVIILPLYYFIVIVSMIRKDNDDNIQFRNRDSTSSRQFNVY